MKAEDKREARKIEKLLTARPRLTPLLGNGPDTLARVYGSIVGDYEMGEQERRDSAGKFNPDKEKKT